MKLIAKFLAQNSKNKHLAPVGVKVYPLACIVSQGGYVLETPLLAEFISKLLLLLGNDHAATLRIATPPLSGTANVLGRNSLLRHCAVESSKDEERYVYGIKNPTL